MFRDHRESLPWLVFCFSSLGHVSLSSASWDIHGLPQFQGSLTYNKPKSMEGTRQPGTGQSKSGQPHWGAGATPVHISGEAGPGSVPGTAVQSQSKRRGHQWPSQLQRELRTWVKATKGCHDLAKNKKHKDARYCLACADYFWLKVMEKVQATGHQILGQSRNPNTSLVHKVSYIFWPSTYINQLILIRGLGRSQVAQTSFYWGHKEQLAD